jgi:outer membrane murein-binding lipoprotein Lpp
MKRILTYILVTGSFLGLCLAGAGVTDAAPSSIEQQLQIMREQMETMQKKMQAMEQELQQTQQSAAQAQQTSQDMQQQMGDVAGRFKMLDDLQAKFGHIKIGGYVRSRWWQAESSQSSFDVTEIAFHLRYDVSENISGEFHIWYHPSGNNFTSSEYNNWGGPTTFFEAAFAEFRNLNIGPVKGTLMVGKNRNQAFGIIPVGTYGGRVTSDYSLFHTSVNISRITGIQYLTSYNNFKWNFAVFNGWGYSNATMYGARRSGIVQLGVGQENTDDNSNKAFSTRLAYTFQRSELFDKLEIGASFLRQDMSNRDLTNINDIMGTPGQNRDRKDQKYGFDIALDKGPFMFKAEYLYGNTADVRAHYWYVMPGFLLSKISKVPLDFFLRYSAATYDEARVANITTRGFQTSGAWDKKQWTPAMVMHLHPRAKLYFEYYLNSVNNPTGTRSTECDYAFVELILFY